VEHKSCPYCAELIAASAARCRCCGEWLPGSDKLRDELAREAEALAAEVEAVRAARTRAGRKNEPWTLRPGERILARSQPFIRRRLIFLALVMAVPTLGATLIVAPFLWLHYRLMRFEWIVTDRRLVEVGGWRERRVESVSLDKVTQIGYRRTFLERLFYSTGTIEVETAATLGVTTLAWAADDDPFRHTVETQVELRRRSVSVLAA
jgi:hypothetical protein